MARPPSGCSPFLPQRVSKRNQTTWRPGCKMTVKVSLFRNETSLVYLIVQLAVGMSSLASDRASVRLPGAQGRRQQCLWDGLSRGFLRAERTEVFRVTHWP